MAQISLKQYDKEIRQIIQSGAIERAIAHCRHILSYYPMYLPVYRLLGYASLEKGDYSYATHFYQTVLSADPEDATAWSRLAVLTDDLGELEQATWLMERAFEVSPGNAEIRGLLRQLYTRRDGVDRPRIKLSSGALARMYAKGGFYQRAVDELQKTLRGASGFAPLHIAYLEVALIEALWHTEKMRPAADSIARRLLDKLPYCLKAHLIIGQIRGAAGMEQEAKQHLEFALSMDPEGYVAYQVFGEHSPIPLQDIQIPYLEREGQTVFVAQPQAGEVQEDLSWLEQVGEIAQTEGVLEPIEDEPLEEMPDWLRDWPAEAQEQPADAGGLEPETRTVEEPATPSWLREMKTQEKEPAIPGWLRDIQQESAEDLDETAMPDWLSDIDLEQVGVETGEFDLAPEQEAGPESTLPQDIDQEALDQVPDWLTQLAEEAPIDTLEPEPETAGQDEELPGWLTELASEQQKESEQEAPQEDEIPDWLSDLAVKPEQAPAAAERAQEFEPEEALAETEIPDWLSEMASGEEELAGEGELGDEGEIPDWLRELQPEAPVQAREPEPEEPFAETEIPAWLSEVAADEEELVAGGPADEGEIPDWLRELQPEAPVQAREPEPEEALAETEIPDWLSEMAADEEELAGEEEFASEDEIPDWLREIEPEVEMPAAAIETREHLGGRTVSTVELPEPVEGMPDWLVELESEIAGAAVMQPEMTTIGEPTAEPVEAFEPPREDEIPDWLRELEPEAEIAVEEPVALVAEEPEPVEEAEIPDWLRELEPEAEIAIEEPAMLVAEEPEPVEEAEIPDWLRELEPEAEMVIEEPAALVAEEPEPVEEAEIPDWLRELEPEAEIAVEEPAALVAEEPEPVEEAEIPDWLRELEPEAEIAVEEPAALVAEEPEPVEEAEIPDWLRELEPEAEMVIEEPAALVAEEPEPIEEAEIPTWLLELEQGATVDLESDATLMTQDEEEEPTWLIELQTQEETASEQITVEEMPEWLEQLHEAVSPVEAVSEPLPDAGLETQIQEPVRVEPEIKAPPEVEAVAQPPRRPVFVPRTEKPPVQVVADQSPLALAHAHLRDDNPDAAAQAFSSLMDDAATLDELVEELETAVQGYSDNAMLYQVLGDAYMRSNRYTAAMDAYKKALNNLG